MQCHDKSQYSQTPKLSILSEYVIMKDAEFENYRNNTEIYGRN